MAARTNPPEAGESGMEALADTASTAAATRSCPHCDRSVAAAAAYCPDCGRHLRPLAVSWRQRAYWKVLLVGFVLYLLAMRILAGSGNPNLVPTVILLGGFLVPVTFVVFLYENNALSAIAPAAVALTFFYGGVLGTLSAQLLEQRLVMSLSLGGLLAVGFSEEVAKLIAIAWLLWKKQYDSEIHGIILGAAAGMGFAAFESMGYGFTALLQSRGNLDVLAAVLLNRGLLSPLAHGTWAAIVAGVLWRERARNGGKLRLNWPVWRAFGGVVVLHALWDFTAGIPIGIGLPGLMLPPASAGLMIPEVWIPIPSLIVGLIGLGILVHLLNEANRPMNHLREDNPMTQPPESLPLGARDPVCGMELTPYDVAITRVRGRQTYYFCSEICAERFDADLSPSPPSTEAA